MSDIFHRLTAGVKELKRLSADLYAPVLAKQAWRGTTFARQSLGDGIEVEVWYLAEHFLLAWHDWHGLRQRYLRYFGQPEEKCPGSWATFDEACRTLVDQLLRSEELGAIIGESWHSQFPIPNWRHLDRLSTKDIYHAIVDAHRRMGLLKWIIRHVAEAADLVPQVQAQDERPYLARLMLEPPVVISNDILRREWATLAREVREDASWHLSQYRRSQLLASWLLPERPHPLPFFHSALLHVLTRERTVPTFDAFIQHLKVGDDDRQTVARVLHRVTEAIAEFGYDGFIEDVTDSEFLGGEDTLVGSAAINIIPSRRKGDCRSILLAVSKGADKKTGRGFPKVLSQVKAHLIDCTDKTRVVIFLCDEWSAALLADHLEELRAHHRRGVRFLFLLVGIPDHTVTPVPVDLQEAA